MFFNSLQPHALSLGLNFAAEKSKYLSDLVFVWSCEVQWQFIFNMLLKTNFMFSFLALFSCRQVTMVAEGITLQLFLQFVSKYEKELENTATYFNVLFKLKWWQSFQKFIQLMTEYKFTSMATCFLWKIICH